MEVWLPCHFIPINRLNNEPTKGVERIYPSKKRNGEDARSLCYRWLDKRSTKESEVEEVVSELKAGINRATINNLSQQSFLRCGASLNPTCPCITSFVLRNLQVRQRDPHQQGFPYTNIKLFSKNILKNRWPHILFEGGRRQLDPADGGQLQGQLRFSPRQDGRRGGGCQC